MQLPPLSTEREIEFIVNDIGNVLLLHKGALKHPYSWAQYDQTTNIFQFITDEGEIQNLGLPINLAMASPFNRTNEIIMVETDDTGQHKDLRFIKFIKLRN